MYRQLCVGTLPNLDPSLVHPSLASRASSEDLQSAHTFARVTATRQPAIIEVTPPIHTVTIQLRGSGPVRWKLGRQTIRSLGRPGGVSITPALESSEYEYPADLEILNWFFAPVFLESIAEAVMERSPGSLDIRGGITLHDPFLRRIGRSLAAEMMAPTFASRLYADSLNLQAAIHVIRRHSNLRTARIGRTPTLAPANLERAREFIRAHAAENVSLNRIAREVGLSACHFARTFKAQTGQSPYRFLLEVRIELAQAMLQGTRESIATIAERTGFSSHSHLTSVFRKLTGITPKQFRSRFESP